MTTLSNEQTLTVLRSLSAAIVHLQKSKNKHCQKALDEAKKIVDVFKQAVQHPDI